VRHPMLVLFSSLLIVCLLSVPSAVRAQDTPKAAKAADAATVPVNLNVATAEQLEKLPGVGPAMAKRILEYRQKNGGFKKIEELMNVRGIGEKAFLRMKPQLTVSAPKPNGQ
jgi:competence protein ComEA